MGPQQHNSNSQSMMHGLGHDVNEPGAFNNVASGVASGAVIAALGSAANSYFSNRNSNQNLNNMQHDPTAVNAASSAMDEGANGASVSKDTPAIDNNSVGNESENEVSDEESNTSDSDDNNTSNVSSPK